MKKYTVLSCLLLVFLVSTLLTGCGTTQTKTTEPPKEETTQETISDLFTKGQNVEGITYEYVLSINGTQTYSGKVCVQGNKMRMESTIEGQKMITIADGQSFIGYNPDQKMAYQISVDQTQQAKTPSEYLEDANAEIDKYKTLETTNYEGVKCRIVSLEGTTDQEQMKMWIREDYGIPVRVETIAADGSKTVLEYKNLKIEKLPEDTFKLPADVQVTDMNDITKQLQQIPSSILGQ
jgi:Outer membrane lipoprotein-sorting protein